LRDENARLVELQQQANMDDAQVVYNEDSIESYDDYGDCLSSYDGSDNESITEHVQDKDKIADKKAAKKFNKRSTNKKNVKIPMQIRTREAHKKLLIEPTTITMEVEPTVELQTAEPTLELQTTTEAEPTLELQTTTEATNITMEADTTLELQTTTEAPNITKEATNISTNTTNLEDTIRKTIMTIRNRQNTELTTTRRTTRNKVTTTKKVLNNKKYLQAKYNKKGNKKA
jgi:hypothetical protein